MQSGQYDKAVNRFKKLNTLHPTNWTYTYYLGVNYIETGSVELGKKCLLDVVENIDDPFIKQNAEDQLKKLEH